MAVYLGTQVFLADALRATGYLKPDSYHETKTVISFDEATRLDAMVGGQPFLKLKIVEKSLGVDGPLPIIDPRKSRLSSDQERLLKSLRSASSRNLMNQRLFEPAVRGAEAQSLEELEFTEFSNPFSSPKLLLYLHKESPLKDRCDLEVLGIGPGFNNNPEIPAGINPFFGEPGEVLGLFAVKGHVRYLGLHKGSKEVVRKFHETGKLGSMDRRYLKDGFRKSREGLTLAGCRPVSEKELENYERDVSDLQKILETQGMEIRDVFESDHYTVHAFSKEVAKRLEVVLGDVVLAPLPISSVDLVLLINSLNFIQPEIVRHVGGIRLAQAVKRGGLIAVTTECSGSTFEANIMDTLFTSLGFERINEIQEVSTPNWTAVYRRPMEDTPFFLRAVQLVEDLLSSLAS